MKTVKTQNYNPEKHFVIGRQKTLLQTDKKRLKIVDTSGGNSYGISYSLVLEEKNEHVPEIDQWLLAKKTVLLKSFDVIERTDCHPYMTFRPVFDSVDYCQQMQKF